MLKNLKKKMNEKKGFTLVELIVVIVIILILAAVLVPNVMKYVNESSKAGVKQDAATVLTQIQADVSWDVAANADATLSKTSAITITSGAVSAGTNYAPAGLASSQVTFKSTSADAKYSAASAAKAVVYSVEKVDNDFIVTAFAYTNGTHWINWTYKGGWSAVDATT